jgi:hypothetical protein
MKKIIFMGVVLLPCMAFASTDCRVVEYPDHDEAICSGDAVVLTSESYQTDGQEQADSSDLTPAEKQKKAAQEIASSRNDLAKVYGDIWLKSRQGR